MDVSWKQSTVKPGAVLSCEAGAELFYIAELRVICEDRYRRFVELGVEQIWYKYKILRNL